MWKADLWVVRIVRVDRGFDHGHEGQSRGWKETVQWENVGRLVGRSCKGLWPMSGEVSFPALYIRSMQLPIQCHLLTPLQSSCVAYPRCCRTTSPLAQRERRKYSIPTPRTPPCHVLQMLSSSQTPRYAVESLVCNRCQLDDGGCCCCFWLASWLAC